MKQRICVAILAGSIAAGVHAAESPSTNVLTVDAVLREVLAHNPSLKAARANWWAMQERAAQDRAWPDPRVGVDVERSDTTRFFSSTDNEWMVSQELPLSGKNRLRARAAEAQADAALAESYRRQLNAFRDARIAFYDLITIQAQLELNAKNAVLLRQFAEITRIKYEAGARMQSDLFMAEMESVKNAEARRDLEQRLLEAQSRLNVLMNRSPDHPLPPATLPHIPEPAYDAVDGEKVALQYRPELSIAEDKIRTAKAQHSLAKRAWIPDPELRIEARQFNGSASIREYDTGIFFNFPWFSRRKYRAAIAEAEFNRQSAEHELAAVQNETRGLVREQLQRIQTLHHHYMLFRDKLVPLARQSVDSARISYNNDKATFLELLTAQQTLQDTESTLQHHLADYLSAIAQFDALVGGHVGPPQYPRP
jgi:outer membrane protein, heavy metal efflux system